MPRGGEEQGLHLPSIPEAMSAGFAMSETISYNRRRFLGASLVTLASAPVVKAKAAQSPFSALKQVNTGVLNVGYAEAGPANGAPVILLHGWPYDIHMYVDVTPLLAASGYRVIVPYLRG